MDASTMEKIASRFSYLISRAVVREKYTPYYFQKRQLGRCEFYIAQGGAAVDVIAAITHFSGPQITTAS
jgi:hypothetical protein